MSILPPARPRATRQEIMVIAMQVFGSPKIPDCYVVGIRGYYLNTMGRPGVNDCGLYDDAIFVVSPNSFSTYNANTDPSRQTPGIATLVLGVHWYRPGNHGLSKPGGGYPAFRPATPGEALTCTRHGRSGSFQGIAINIHRGGLTTTSSAGCQTIHPGQWDEFHATLTRELKATNQTRFPYILTQPVN